MKIGQHEIDNRWIVPYCPLLAKTFNAHINVEFCNSVKSIKYVCKYVNKGSDAAMFALQETNIHDEITQYEIGRYISSNEAFWRIFGFPIHERHPAIQQLAVHLENGQRIYFTKELLHSKSKLQRTLHLQHFLNCVKKMNLLQHFSIIKYHPIIHGVRIHGTKEKGVLKYKVILT